MKQDNCKPRKIPLKEHLITVLNNVYESNKRVSRKELHERVMSVSNLKSKGNIDYLMGFLIRSGSVIRIDYGMYYIPEEIKRQAF